MVSPAEKNTKDQAGHILFNTTLVTQWIINQICFKWFQEENKTRICGTICKKQILISIVEQLNTCPFHFLLATPT